jgi:hypothetical protein
MIHTALLLLLSPVVYWLSWGLLVGGWHFDFGSVLVLAIGVPMSYVLFSFSLLIACAAATFVAVQVSRRRLLFQRLGLGALAGAGIGALLGGYIATKLAQDAAAVGDSSGGSKELIMAGLITGAVLGLLFSSLWRLSCSWAYAVSRGLFHQAASPSAGAAEAVSDSSASGGAKR